MWTHKERQNCKRQIETSRENLRRMLADEKVSDKAKEAFNRPLFGGLSNPRKEQNAKR